MIEGHVRRDTTRDLPAIKCWWGTRSLIMTVKCVVLYPRSLPPRPHRFRPRFVMGPDPMDTTLRLPVTVPAHNVRPPSDLRGPRRRPDWAWGTTVNRPHETPTSFPHTPRRYIGTTGVYRRRGWGWGKEREMAGLRSRLGLVTPERHPYKELTKYEDKEVTLPSRSTDNPPTALVLCSRPVTDVSVAVTPRPPQ